MRLLDQFIKATLKLITLNSSIIRVKPIFSNKNLLESTNLSKYVKTNLKIPYKTHFLICEIPDLW